MDIKEKQIQDLNRHISEIQDILTDAEDNFDDHRILINELNQFFSDMDEIVDRVDDIGGYGVGNIELVLPQIFDQGPLKPDTRDMRMFNLHTTVLKSWESGCRAYIHGNFLSSTLTFTTTLESILKFKLEEHKIEYTNCNLNCCIDKLVKNDIINSDGDLHTRLKILRNIRNDLVHMNLETEGPRSLLGKLDLIDEYEQIDDNDQYTVITADGETKEKPAKDVFPGSAFKIKEYKVPAVVLLEFVRDIKESLYPKEEYYSE